VNQEMEMRKPIAVGFLSLLGFVVVSWALMPAKASSQTTANADACGVRDLACEDAADARYDSCLRECRTESCRQNREVDGLCELMTCRANSKVT
jgi:hypothetical protein